MRLAEFKTRLFIIFAGKLLKWAESIEREITDGHSQPATPVDDSNAVLLAERSRERESASEPPEYWARLVRKDPPQHWLDLIKEKAPDLLPPTWNEPLSPPDGATVVGRTHFKMDTGQEASGPLVREHEPVTRSQPQSPLSLSTRRSRGKPNYSSARAARSTWLNRLRFQPPATPVKDFEPGFVEDISDSSRAAGGAAEHESAPISQQTASVTGENRDRSVEAGSARFVVAQESSARSSRSFRGSSEESDGNPQHQGTGSAESPHSDSDRVGEAQPSNYYVDHTAAAQIPRRTQVDFRQAIRLNSTSEHDLFEGSTPEGSRNPSTQDRNVESPPPKAVAHSSELNPRPDREFAEREGDDSPQFVLPDSTVDEHAVELNFVPSRVARPATTIRPVDQNRTLRSAGVRSHTRVATANMQVWNQALAFENPAVNSVGSDEHARNEFALAEPNASTSTKSRVESREKLWPTLPAAPKFDIADELASKEQEAEGLRRLEQEQRGILWNG